MRIDRTAPVREAARRKHYARQLASRRRTGLLTAAMGVILSGLALRTGGYDLGLPFFVVKYGGSTLWGGMVYLLIAASAVRWPRLAVVALSFSLAVFIELFRLHHTPALDAFRLTTAGTLLLGRVFSFWNIVAYVIGIAVVAGLDRLCEAEPKPR